MSKKIIAANWKMNLLRKEASQLVAKLISKIGAEYSRAEVVLFPPFTLLETVENLISGSGIQLGAQDFFWEGSGAYTGEISCEMLKDLSCSWVIVGHSERRNLFGESNQSVNKKLKAALKKDLNVILCVGESLEQREQGKEKEIIKNQVEIALKDIDNDRFKNIFVAYEPIWAIGTGRNASPEQISEMHTVIKRLIREVSGNARESVKVLYGGSVSPENIEDIIKSNSVDGALVGGASLNADSFSEIVTASGD